MRVKKLSLSGIERTKLFLGYVGENEHTQIRFDASCIYTDNPGARAGLTMQNPAGTVFPIVLDADGKEIIWNVSASDVAIAGNGSYQLTFTDNDEIIKTFIGQLFVLKSLTSAGDIPTPIENWIDQANQKLSEVEAATESIDNMDASATKLAPDASPTVTVSDVDGHKHLDFGIPQGEKGDKGEKGDTYEVTPENIEEISSRVVQSATIAQYTEGMAEQVEAAQQHARDAGESATAADTAKKDAAQSAQAASQSATAANTSARNAAQSETNAGNSASAASQSAQAASQSASNAATSERNAADSAQDAQDVLDSIPADYSTLSTDVTNLKSALHNNLHLIATGTYSKGVTVFTSSDVNVGDKIKWRVGGDAGYIGDVELYDANDTFKGAIGKTTNGDSPTMFEGTWTVPSWFAYAKTYSTSNKPIYIEYVFNNVTEERINEIEDVTIPALNNKVDANHNYDLQEFNKVFGYNLIGTAVNTDYPVLIAPGEKITFSRQDGGIFPTASTLEVSFKGKTKNTLVGWSLKNGETSKTWTNGTTSDICYMSINGVSTSPLMANYGATAMPYQVYISDTLEKRINGNKKNINISAAINSEFKKFAIGEKTNNEVLFTSDDVAPGDVVCFDFTSPDGAIQGYIEFIDASNNVVNFYLYPTAKHDYNAYTSKSLWGRTAVGNDADYKGRLIVPSSFSICRVKANGNNVVIFRELYVESNEYRLASKELTIPPYYFENDYLPAKVLSINDRLESNMAYGDAFAFVTDIHVSGNEFHSPALLGYIGRNTCLDKVFVGGDLLSGGLTYEYVSARGYMNLLREGFNRPVHFIIGNHEIFNSNISSRWATYGDAMFNDFNGNPVHHYYYFDNKRTKIRYIVLAKYYEGQDNAENGYYIDPVQQNWFKTVALNLDDGWAAVILVHEIYYFTFTTTKELVLDPRGGAMIEDDCDAYNVSATSKGEIIAIVQGHTHVDRVLRTPGGIPIIITTADQNAGCYTDPPSIVLPEGVEPRASGTIREQAFDVMIIDRRKDANNQGTIYAVRVGCEAYDGTGTTMADFGTATQERIVKFDTKFDASDWD